MNNKLLSLRMLLVLMLVSLVKSRLKHEDKHPSPFYTGVPPPPTPGLMILLHFFMTTGCFTLNVI